MAETYADEVLALLEEIRNFVQTLDEHGRDSEIQVIGLALTQAFAGLVSVAEEEEEEAEEEEETPSMATYGDLLSSNAEALSELGLGDFKSANSFFRAKSKAKAKAKKDWPNDRHMQLHTIEEQMAAVKCLKRGRPRGIPRNVFENVRTKAAEKWPEDFNMRLHTETEQFECFQKFQAVEKKAKGALLKMLQHASEEWPDDYKMRLYELNQQIEAARQLEGY